MWGAFAIPIDSGFSIQTLSFDLCFLSDLRPFPPDPVWFFPRVRCGVVAAPCAPWYELADELLIPILRPVLLNKHAPRGAEKRERGRERGREIGFDVQSWVACFDVHPWVAAFAIVAGGQKTTQIGSIGHERSPGTLANLVLPLESAANI